MITGKLYNDEGDILLNDLFCEENCKWIERMKADITPDCHWVICRMNDSESLRCLYVSCIIMNNVCKVYTSQNDYEYLYLCDGALRMIINRLFQDGLLCITFLLKNTDELLKKTCILIGEFALKNTKNYIEFSIQYDIFYENNC